MKPKFCNVKDLFFCACMLLFTHTVKAQSPGGFSTGLRLWLKADDVSFNATADGVMVTQWNDRSGNGYTLEQSNTNNRPVYGKSTPANLVNFNPSVIFTNSPINTYLQNTTSLLGTTATAFHFIVVAKSTINNTARTGLFNIGASAGSPSLDFEKDGSAPNFFNPYVAAGSAPGESSQPNTAHATVYNGGGLFRNTTANIPGSMTTIINNRQPQIFGLSVPSGDNNLNCYIDGFHWVNDRRPSSAAFTANGFKVGIGSGITNYAWVGNINEVIAYNAELSANDLQKVNSYLAIKYGITIGQGNNSGNATSGVWNVGNNAANVNYLYANGSIMWNASAGFAGYTYDIAGIVRDDASALYQKQSESVNYGAFVTIGLGTINTTNTTNNNVFSATNSGLLWAANKGGLPKLQPSSAYSVNTDGFNGITDKIWRVQRSGVGLNGKVIRIAIAAANGIINPLTGKLIISSDGVFDKNGETVYNLVASGGYLYADVQESVLVDGYYFALGDLIRTPGGVSNNLAAWFKADAGIKETIGGNLSTEGGAVAEWENQVSGGVNVANIGSFGTSTAPLFYGSNATRLVNYNPSVYFNGSNSFGLYNTTTNILGGNATGCHFIAVARDVSTSLNIARSPMGNGFDGNNPGFDIQKDGFSPNGWNFYTNCGGEYNGGNATMYNGGGVGIGSTTVPVPLTNQIFNRQPQILGLSVSAVTASCEAQVDSWVDAYKVTTALTKSFSHINQPRFFIGSSQDAPWQGDINEIIAFKNRVTDPEMQRINSYLAIKYGITLGQGNNTSGDYKVGENRAQYDYMASNGSVVWPALTLNAYRWNIAGIGRDDNSGLLQKQSTSVNYCLNNQVTIGLGSISATGNSGNANVYSNDRSFLVWGDNGHTVSLQALGLSAPTFSFNGYTSNIRMQRTWAIQATNFSRRVMINIPGSSIGTISTTGCQKLCLIISTDPSFTNIISAQILSGTVATNYSVAAIFPAGISYFTYARVEELASGKVFLPSELTTSMASDDCFYNGWQYYYADVAKTQKLFALKANGNSLPTFGTGAGQISGTIGYHSAPYVVTDGVNTTHIMGRTLTVTDNTNASYNTNGGVKVRVYFNQSELDESIVDNVISYKWFKHPGSLINLLSDQTARTITNATFYNTLTQGEEDGERFVAFDVNSFSTFGFASNAGDNLNNFPLPVTIKSFTALLVGSQSNLKWEAGIEESVSRYEVFRSTDGVEFDQIGVVPASGLSEYNYIDNEPKQGENYYRLKIVDNDNSFKFSGIRSVKVKIESSRITILPNPANSYIRIESTGIFMNVVIYSAAGKQVYNSLASSTFERIVDISRFPMGLYYIQLTDDSGVSVSKKFIISR
jgi:hypothetical protein